MARSLGTKDAAAITCPACGADVWATLFVEIGELQHSPDDPTVATADVRIVGMRISHDCAPPAAESLPESGKLGVHAKPPSN